MGEAYDINADPDVNSFDADALKDLTMAGVGTGFREFTVLIGFIIILLVVGFFASVIVKAVSKGR